MTLQSLVGNWVYIRPVSRDDYPAIHEWRSDLRYLHLWQAQRRVLSFDEFIPEIESTIRTSILLTVVETSSNRPVGIVQAYNVNQVDRWAHLLMFLEPDSWSRGYALEAGILFTRYLFRNYGLRKLYAETVEYNEASLTLLRRIGFVEEGRRRHHTWYDDRYWDSLLLALYREEWDIRHARWEQLLRIREDVGQLAAVHEARRQHDALRRMEHAATGLDLGGSNEHEGGR